MATGDLIIPEGFGNAVFTWAIDGRTNPFSVSMGYSPEASVDPTEHGEVLFEDFTATGAPGAAAGMMDNYHFLGVACTYNDAGTMLGGGSTQPPVNGTAGTSDTLLVSGAILVRKLTGLVGKHYRGRFYAPSTLGSEANIDNFGIINPTLLAALGVRWDAFFTNLGTGSPVIIPNLLHHEPAVGTAPVPTPITSFVVQSQVATQRRRLR